MQHYLVRSLGQSVLVIVGSMILVFMMIRISGDPLAVLLPREASPEQIEEMRHKMGFDRPLVVQFLDYAASALTGDFGSSLQYKVPALPLILERLPATLELAGVALIMAVGVAVPLGAVSGEKPGTLWDWIGRTVGLLGQSTPSFWLGMILIIIFAVKLRWLPACGRDSILSVVLPAFTLSLPMMGRLVRLMRSTVLEIKGADYVRTAYAKGLSTQVVYARHILKNAAPPLVSFLGVQLGYLLCGSLIIETIFAWPGLGRLVVEAVSARDFALVQSIALFSSVVVATTHLLTDITYAWIDPRVRYE